MNKVTFQAYARTFDSGKFNLPAGGTLSHAFVVSSDDYDWNCWGDGIEAAKLPDTLILSNGVGSAYSKWASYIYGPNVNMRADQNPRFPVAGLYERYDGVCHNAANRILVLCGPGIDVSQAPVNPLVTLLYGKYGFNISQYIQLVRSAAAQVNAEEPGSISPDEIDAVVKTISNGAIDELNILDNDILSSHFEEQINLQGISGDKAQSLREIYADFQTKRQATFAAAQAQNPGTPNMQGTYWTDMEPVLTDCLVKMMNVLGEQQYLAIFQANPQEAVAFLLRG